MEPKLEEKKFKLRFPDTGAFDYFSGVICNFNVYRSRRTL